VKEVEEHIKNVSLKYETLVNVDSENFE